MSILFSYFQTILILNAMKQTSRNGGESIVSGHVYQTHHHSAHTSLTP